MAATRRSSRGRSPSPARSPKAKSSSGKKHSAWATYQTLLIKRPMTMNIVQSAIINVLAVLTQQTMCARDSRP